MSLPIFTTNNKDFSLMQTQWASQLNPLLSNPTNNSSLLKNISLVSGTNVVNTLLGRKMQGWIVADVDAAVQIYRSAPFNDLTLTLNSSGPAIVTLVVF